MARELQRIQEEQEERELQQVKKRKEEEEYAAYMCAERAKQVAQRKREEERRNAKKEAKAKSRVWLGECDDFAKARCSMKELARCIWYAQERDVRVDGAPHCSITRCSGRSSAWTPMKCTSS